MAPEALGVLGVPSAQPQDPPGNRRPLSHRGSQPHLGSRPPHAQPVTSHLLALGAHVSRGSWEALRPGVPLEARSQKARSGVGPVPITGQATTDTRLCAYGDGAVMGAAGGHRQPRRCEAATREQRPAEVTSASRGHQAGGWHPACRVCCGSAEERSASVGAAWVNGWRPRGRNGPLCV